MVNRIILSVIVPIKISEFNTFLYRRLQRFLNYFEAHDDVEYVIVDSTEQEKYSQAIKSCCEKAYNTIYCYKQIKEPFSAARSRNYGADIAKGKYLIFFDIDLMTHQDYFLNVLTDVNSLSAISKEAFTIYPCLYLTESYSYYLENVFNEGWKEDKDIERISLELTQAKLDCLKGKKDKVLYPAISTSTILVNKEHFLEVGGYYEGFSGHGYEDFFLIHTLSYHYPLAVKGKDYFFDYKTDYLGLYLGFRQYFAYYALENLFNRRYTVHMYHERSKKRIYYLKRDENSVIFQNRLQDLGRSIARSDFVRYDDYQDFINNTFKKYGFKRKQISGFYRPYLDKSMRNIVYRLYRKVRKMFLQPKKFFSDIRLEKYWY